MQVWVKHYYITTYRTVT